MSPNGPASWFLAHETRALLTRLERVKPFAINMPMVNAATVPPGAWIAIERHMIRVRRELQKRIYAYLKWLNSSSGRRAKPTDAQRVFRTLKLEFNTMLDQLDIFADVLTQRGEHENGVWLAGLDVVAADTLNLADGYYRSPPVVCYLDRGHGAAIRRARTRLPGGKKSPVAIIRIPRERMVGSGIASSLTHEVGHQGAALLDLMNSIRPVLRVKREENDHNRLAWTMFERWISEIIADFWSLAKVGVAATQGLISVVSLPRWFVFRINLDDPHPFPWIRVKLSCAMGRVLFPHAQWERLSKLWEAFYPTTGLDEKRRRTISVLETTIPSFIHLFINHEPKALRGKKLIEAFPIEARQPARLQAHYNHWRSIPAHMYTAPPSMVFAAIGQARVDGKVSPEEEGDIIAKLLIHWALHNPLKLSAVTPTWSTEQGKVEYRG